MKVRDTKNKEHHLDVRQSSYPLKSQKACKSKIQYNCGQLIKQKFPLETILEEVPLPGENLTIDFLLPTRKIAFEVHGRQHDEFVAHYHKDQRGFLNSQSRDNRKQLWCDINEIELYIVRSEEEMKELLE